MKTIKHIIGMAALALTAATWSACSNVDEPTTTEQPAQARTYTLTTTLSPRDGGTRSKMEYVDETTGITAEWEENDQIWVQYDDNSLAGTAETTATVTAVDPTTKAATITVTLTDPKDDGNITFGYPLSHWNGITDPDKDQIGTLDDINANHASIYGNGTLTVSGSDVTLVSPVTMNPEMCIWKFTFTDGSSAITSAITKLIIDFPNNGMTYEVTPTSLNTIYVAMYGDVIHDQPINIYAKTATGFYLKSAASVTLDAGTTYTSTDLALSAIAVGQYVNKDGSITTTKQTNGDNESQAVIAYVGSVPNYCDNLIAIALEDVDDNYHPWTSTSSVTALSAVNTFAAAHPIHFAGSDYIANELGSSVYDAVASSTTTSSATRSASVGLLKGWRLPSVTDWRYIFQGLGGPSATSPVGIVADGTYGNATTLRTAINAYGKGDLKADLYWCSSEDNENNSNVWFYYFLGGYGGSNFQSTSKETSCYVRAVFAW